MRAEPTAFAFVDPDVTIAPAWDEAQVQRLACRLGYRLVWPGESLVPLVDRVRAADADAVIVPAAAHLDVVTLHASMCVVDVETVCPRMSFER